MNMADRLAVLSVVRERVRGAVVNFALYILGEAANTPNRANRLAWAREAMRDPTGWTERMLPYLLNLPEYATNGSDVTDAQLKGHIETAIVTHYIASA